MLRMRVALLMALMMFGAAACSKGGGGGRADPDDMDLGNAQAKVTVVEYASVGCPVCAKWQKEVYPAFKAKYIDTNKIHYVFREMLVGQGAGDRGGRVRLPGRPLRRQGQVFRGQRRHLQQTRSRPSRRRARPC